MASITSAGTGDWNVGATWVGGVAPVLGDKVTIASGHVVTVNTTGLAGGDDTSTAINVNGTLKFSRAASSDLRVRGQMVVGSAGLLDMGQTGDLIPAAYKATLYLNDSAALSDGKWGLEVADLGARVFIGGAARTRAANLTAQATAAATSISVDDVTGWENGDLLAFEATGSASNEQEIRTISGAITGTGPYTVPLSSALTYTHHHKYPVTRFADGGKVCNLSGNVTIRSWNDSYRGYVDLGPNFSGTDGVGKLQLQNASFLFIGPGIKAGVAIGRSSVAGRLAIASGLAFYQFGAWAINANGLTDYKKPFEDCVFYSSLHTTGEPPFGYGSTSVPLFRRCVFVKHGAVQAGCVGPSDTAQFHVAEDCVFGAVESGAHHFWSRYPMAGTCEEYRCRHMSAPTSIYGWHQTARLKSYETDYCLKVADGGLGNPAGVRLFNYPYGATIAIELLLSDHRFSAFSTEFEGLPAGTLLGKQESTINTYANVQRNPLTQNTRTPLGSITRDNVGAYDASGSCLKFEPVSATSPLRYVFQILAPTGSSVLVAGFAKRSASGVTFTVTMSGLGITPVVQTLSGATGATTWQQWSLAAVQSSGADSLLTVTIEVSGTSGNCLVDQIVAPPTKAITTGDLGLWYDGLPANLVVANYVSALDIWNMQTSQLTLAGSVGKQVVDNVDATISSRLAAAGYTAPDNARILLIEKILRNKIITDPATGIMTIYDNDDTTVLMQGALWEDAAGAQAYRGQGAERRERLA